MNHLFCLASCIILLLSCTTRPDDNPDSKSCKEVKDGVLASNDDKPQEHSTSNPDRFRMSSSDPANKGSSDMYYNLDLDPSKETALTEFLDSVRTMKVESKEPILMKWFAGHILKASKDHLFLKLATSKTIYGLDRKTFRVIWKLNLDNNSPEFPQTLFDFALRDDTKELYIWDYQKKLFYIYNYDGEFIRNLIPETLPERNYFSYYNSVQDAGIIFHLQGFPERGEVYSEEYENKITAFYSFLDNRFSKLMTINQGSPKRNSNMSRFFLPSLGGKLHYFYNYGHEVYQMESDTIRSIINLRSDLFFDHEHLNKIDYMDVQGSNHSGIDLDFINQLLKKNKFGSHGGFIEKENYYALILMGTPGIYFFLLSKDDSKYKYYKVASEGHGGFTELDDFGCVKAASLHQMPDGTVYSITDGLHFNNSDLDCEYNTKSDHQLQETIADEDVLITEYFFSDEIEF